MKAFILFCLLLAGGFSQAQTNTEGQEKTEEQEKVHIREFTMEEGDTTYTMKEYYLLIYLRGEQAGDFNEHELKDIQAGHMSHISKLADAGQVHIAGPFGDDTEKRGILIFDVESLEKAKELASQDPAVKAGRLTFEIHPWWAAVGSSLR